MKRGLLGLSFTMLFAVAAMAQTAGEAPATNGPASGDAPPQPAKRPLLKYAAPKSLSGSGARVDGDGGSRGIGAKDSAIYLLAPSGEALTTRKQPSLFYFQQGAGGASKTSLTLIVVDPTSSATLFKAKAENPDPGFHRIQLARHPMELLPGVRYEWRVSLGGEGDGHSSDVFASAVIRYVEPSRELARDLEATPDKRAEIYAQHGIWYDALEEVSNRILAEPQNPDWKQARASLLEQIGLGRILETGKER
jgi:hypothetical protein